MQGAGGGADGGRLRVAVYGDWAGEAAHWPLAPASHPPQAPVSPVQHLLHHSYNLTPLSPYNIPPSTQHPAVHHTLPLTLHPRDSTISHHVAINLLFIFTRMQLANVNE